MLCLAGFDLGGQVAIGFSHWNSPFPEGGHDLPSPDCIHSEASGVPPISEHLEPVSCPASLSITPLPTCSASQETLCDSSTSTSDSMTNVQLAEHFLGQICMCCTAISSSNFYLTLALQ